MQNYYHTSHAGNFADVIKHIIVVEILSYLSHQRKPYVYVDTHAGAGMYSLASEQSGEYIDGVARLIGTGSGILKKYLAIIEKYNSSGKLARYPGSPLIAASFLRVGDRAYLFELNADVYNDLRENTAYTPSIISCAEDGYAGLLKSLPLNAENCFALLDPAYQDDRDYHLALKTLLCAYSKRPDAIYAIWYPVISRTRVDELKKSLKTIEVKNIQQYELCVKASLAKGMSGAGVFVVNPPPGLSKKMPHILSELNVMLAQDEEAFYYCDD